MHGAAWLLQPIQSMEISIRLWILQRTLACQIRCCLDLIWCLWFETLQRRRLTDGLPHKLFVKPKLAWEGARGVEWNRSIPLSCKGVRKQELFRMEPRCSRN